MAETRRVAIVTGAAGGIGRAMTRGLLAAGIRVAGVDRDREPLETLASSAREQDKADDLLTIQTDLTSDAATEEAIELTPGDLPRVVSGRLSRPRGRLTAGQKSADGIVGHDVGKLVRHSKAERRSNR
jgi:NAD(P)-dependent dehydrogenase (short-subunit alcohol dehydrogenase family)